MNRREFVKTCSGACLALVGLPLLLDSCTTTRYITVAPENNKLKIPLDSFTEVKDGKTIQHRHILVKTSALQHPVAVYKMKDGSYNALLMRCTHQGIELHANGDMLSCSAHGSEFSNSGEVITGPADSPLQKFITATDATHLFIELQ